ncbi:MAG: OmpA family protein [Dysgonamonadaceae bacterium]|jgi:outer membrane protein OmpA-like peptidoglycan-associated protein|nr:OmpA family protein [Dysgonamonadaceae bacterium]
MKTKFILIGLMLSFSLYSVAQETQEAGYKTAFKHSKAGENWFIQLGAGGQAYFGDNDDKADLTNRVTLAPVLAIGKWFSPYWGVRVKGQGGSIHHFETDAKYMEHDKYYNVHIDAMWNLSNYWGVYSPNKVFNFTPYIGLGFAHRFERDAKNGFNAGAYGANLNYNGYPARYSDVLSVNSGIQFGFRLGKRVNLDFDLGAQIVPDYFERVTSSKEIDAILTASAGLTFKLGKTDFDVVALDQSLIDDLNGKINALRSENEQLRKRPVSCPECPKVAAPIVKNEINYVPNVVFFRLNSSKVDANQKISIYNTSEFIKSTGEKIKVIGYADKKTGSTKYNLELSEKRAKAVAKELTTKYNIPSEKITIEWKGADVQPYKENNWNRVVIMNAE